MNAANAIQATYFSGRSAWIRWRDFHFIAHSSERSNALLRIDSPCIRSFRSAIFLTE